MGSSSHLALMACYIAALVPAFCKAECTETFLISAAPGPNPQGQILNKDNGSPSLSACIASCNNYNVCKGFYYEDTTCLLFSSPITFNSDHEGQEVGGTLGEKFCVKGCRQPWAAELFRNSELPVGNPTILPAASRQECIQLCVSNTHFQCSTRCGDNSGLLALFSVASAVVITAGRLLIS